MAGGEFKRGSMDITQHRETWTMFIMLTKWTCVAIVVVLALMALFLT